jgi:hypothetical protein
LRSTKLESYSELLLEEGGLLLCDVPFVKEAELEHLGMTKAFHRKRFLRHQSDVSTASA